MLRSMTLAVLAIGLLVSPAFAQNSTPQVIKVQGYLSDKSGGTPVPVTGTFAMTFDLYDAEVGGISIQSIACPGTLCPTGVDVTNGLYEVELGFPATAFDAATRYIEITVEGETLWPRIRVVSAPFAYVAQKLDGFEATDLEESDEITAGDANLQTQIDEINTQLPSVGNTLDQAYDQGGPGVGKSIVADTGAVNIDGSGGLTVSGRVGIGTTVPTAPLSVVAPGLQTDLTGNAVRFNRTSAAQSYIDKIDGGPLIVRMGPDSFPVMTVQSDGDSGKVGIGTTNPQTRLHLRGNAELLWLEGADHAYISWFPHGAAAGRKAWLGFGSSLSHDFNIRNEIGNATVTLASNGNVGVGTTDPVRTLDVAGTARTRVLEITGADMVEGFETGDAACDPGTVVVIDPERPETLVISTEPYDTKVAGVVSGAGGVPHGIYMGQDGALDGTTLVAMAGRVYALATASNGPIRPGDRLTTSTLAGHAMKVQDRALADGATLGKAMSSLDEGEGLVLVLVNLQ